MKPAHVGFQARLTACFEGRVVSDPREEPYHRKILGLDDGTWAETANYQAMLAASWLWRVLLAEVEPDERRLAFAQVVKLYELEREQGMCRGECLCPDPHAGMHLEAHTAILCATLEHPRPKLMPFPGQAPVATTFSVQCHLSFDRLTSQNRAVENLKAWAKALVTEVMGQLPH